MTSRSLQMFNTFAIYFVARRGRLNDLLNAARLLYEILKQFCRRQSLNIVLCTTIVDSRVHNINSTLRKLRERERCMYVVQTW